MTVLTAGNANANRFNEAPVAHYNQYSQNSLDMAAVDRLLSRTSATEGSRSFVPAYPAPQQRYIRVPAQQPSIAARQAPQYYNQYQAPAGIQYGW